jgi:predicted nucleotidyltransferase
MRNKRLFQTIIKKIRENFNPEKIILFGSYAWGKPSKDSDIDLFIIMNSNVRRDERAFEILKLFPDRFFGLDVIVYTPEEVRLSIKRGNFFIQEILKKGKLLYG